MDARLPLLLLPTLTLPIFAQGTTPAGPAAEVGAELTLQAIPIDADNNSVVESPSHVAFFTREYADGSGQDLNGDGDQDDEVLAVYSRATGLVDVTSLDGIKIVMGNGFVAMTRRESDSGTDWSGDGDALDDVVVIYDLETQTSEILPPFVRGVSRAAGSVAALVGDDFQQPLVAYSHSSQSIQTLASSVLTSVNGGLIVKQHGLAMRVEETPASGDLNGDGDTFDAVLRLVSPDLGTIVDTGFLCSYVVALEPDYAVFRTAEFHLGSDLNGDGDLSDLGLFQADRVTGTVRLLGAVDTPPAQQFVRDGRVYFEQDEGYAGDLNGDGDTLDRMLVAHPLGGITAQRSGIRGSVTAAWGDRALVNVEEAELGMDLNGDQDQQDSSVVIWDLGQGTIHPVGWASTAPGGSSIGADHATFLILESGEGVDFNGDGDFADSYPAVLDLATMTSERLALTTPSFGMSSPRNLQGGFLFSTSELQHGDLNGDGDAIDLVLHQHRILVGSTVSLGFTGTAFVSTRRKGYSIGLNEGEQLQDFTGDGDQNDSAILLGVWN